MDQRLHKYGSSPAIEAQKSLGDVSTIRIELVQMQSFRRYYNAPAKSLTAKSRVFPVSRGAVSKTRIPTSFHHGVTFVSYEGNSFSVKFQNSGGWSAMHIVLLAGGYDRFVCVKQVQKVHETHHDVAAPLHSLSGVRVLIDPWLEGDLTFLDQAWIYRGKKRVLNTTKGGKVDIDQIAAETDVVVLTQV